METAGIEMIFIVAAIISIVGFFLMRLLPDNGVGPYFLTAGLALVIVGILK
jgi:drug/metabolite transporter superfamily protein YnfA